MTLREKVAHAKASGMFDRPVTSRPLWANELALRNCSAAARKIARQGADDAWAYNVRNRSLTASTSRDMARGRLCPNLRVGENGALSARIAAVNESLR